MKVISGRRAQPMQFINLNSCSLSESISPTNQPIKMRMLPNPQEQPQVPHISPSTMNPPRLGMSCAGSVAVPTCPVMPILPPHPTRRSQGVQSLSPPGILALSWPQSKIKNRAVLSPPVLSQTSSSKLSENIISLVVVTTQVVRVYHSPSQPYYHDDLCELSLD